MAHSSLPKTLTATDEEEEEKEAEITDLVTDKTYSLSICLLSVYVCLCNISRQLNSDQTTQKKIVRSVDFNFVVNFYDGI